MWSIIASEQEHEYYRNVCEEFNNKLIESKHVTSFEKIKQGEVVYVTHYAGNKWIPVQGIYEYTKSDGNLGITYISSFDRDDKCPRTISLQPNREVFLTEQDCRDYINHYWYHHKCDNCKYDKYSAEQNCYNCKNRVQFEKKNITDDTSYYCKKLFDKTGLKYSVASYYNRGYPICNQFETIVNNGDWIDFHWYIDVMKNCWCNTDKESNCSAKDTVEKRCSFKQELHKVQHISIKQHYGDQEYIIHSYVSYYQWLKQTWIEDNKIFISKISIVETKNTRNTKYKDIQIDDYKSKEEIEQIVINNISK